MSQRFDWTRRNLLIASATTLAATLAPASGLAAEYDKADLGLFGGINRVKDAANMTGVEQKHAPLFEAPSKAKPGDTVAVTIRVGSVPHPMTDSHWIERVRVFTDKGAPIADISFARTGVAPVVTVQVPVAATITLIAQAFCNLHGIWESRHRINV